MRLTELLLVEDDLPMRETLARFLTQEGFAVRLAGDGRSVDAAALAGVALVLCDVNLPDESGFDVAKRLRAQHADLGLIMVTGRGDLIDRVLGLEFGADDYIQKPFELRELLARIRAVLRRRKEKSPAPSPEKPTTTIVFGGWVIDPRSRRVVAPDGREVDLTTTEFDILSLLGERQCQAVTRETLYGIIRGKEWSPLDRTLDTHVANLRKKLDHLGYKKLIKTVHGQGYILAPLD